MTEYVTRLELDAAIRDVREDIDRTEERLEGRLTKRLDRQDILLLAILAGVFGIAATVIGGLIYLVH